MRRLLKFLRDIQHLLVSIAEISEEIEDLTETCARLEHDIIRLDASLDELSRIMSFDVKV